MRSWAVSWRSAGRRSASSATDFGIGVIFWALPLLLAAIWPQMWAAFLAVFILGMANPVVDVNASTILQRKTADDVMGRVFGALDTALIGAMALGSAVMPIMIHFWGLRWSLAILAIVVSASVLPAFGRLKAMDEALREPEGLALLRQVPLFAPLELKSLERIAQQLVRIEVPAGEVLIHEGDEGDRFYVIESGQMTATFEGAVLRQMGPGDPFGEIALLRDVPRTATVTADEPSVVHALDRADFLDAVTGEQRGQQPRRRHDQQAHPDVLILPGRTRWPMRAIPGRRMPQSGQWAPRSGQMWPGHGPRSTRDGRRR